MLAALAAGEPALAKPILVRAPRTVVVLAQKWADAYSKEHPDAEIEVTGGGPDAGLIALQRNKADLALSPRKIKPAESQDYARMYGRRLREYRVAVDSLCVYVNAENPVSELDLGQIAKIFTGKIRNWKQVGGADVPITVYGREASSGAYEFLRTQVLQGADFVSGAQPMPSAASVLKAVTRDKQGIGFAGAATSPAVRALKIKKTPDSTAVESTEENLLGGRYPISRFLYAYLNPVLDRGEVGAFIDWIRSDEGQKIARETGCHPLPPNWREKTYAGTNNKP